MRSIGGVPGDAVDYEDFAVGDSAPVSCVGVVEVHVGPVLSLARDKAPVVLADAEVRAEAGDRFAEGRVDADVLGVREREQQRRVVQKLDEHA
jgi:hypothetical protein